MKNTFFCKYNLLTICFLLVLSSCKEKSISIQAAHLKIAENGLIPNPAFIEESDLAFTLQKNTQIILSDKSEILKELGHFTREKIFQKTGIELAISDKINKNTNFIKLSLQKELIPDSKFNHVDGNTDLNAYLANPYEINEAYELEIGETSVSLKSVSAAGLFRGIQTLRQLIPNQATELRENNSLWVLPGGIIRDVPKYTYRGAMLDVARHFFSIAEVKRYIDQLAYYKINTLHLHLTDDQGWRIYIDAWPKLTEIGGSTEVGGGNGGYFTKEQYKDIVSYAAKHYITVIPEVDMPSHTNAATVAYPFLNGNGKTPELYTGIEVGFSTWDANKENVYAFIKDVVTEISDMTPGPYFHLGGDESHVTPKDDFIKFVDRVNEIVLQTGKTPIGWDEIVNAHTDSNTVVQFWDSEKNASTAAKKKMKVILSPAKKAYLDMQYREDSPYGLHWAGYVPVDTAYVWTPETYAKGVPEELILGIEAPLWSETISNSDELEFLAFPRLPGYAELAWSIPEKRSSWETYKKRLAKQSHYFDRQGIQYYKSPKIDWEIPSPKKPSLGKD